MSLSEVWTFVEEQPVLGSSKSFQLVGFPTNDSPVWCVGVRGCWELVARDLSIQCSFNPLPFTFQVNPI